MGGMMSRLDKQVGKFKLSLSTDGWPIRASLEHIEPNGSTNDLILSGEEELHDLQFLVARALAHIAEQKRG